MSQFEEQWDGVRLAFIADRVGTPVYVYAAPAIRARIAALQQALSGLDAEIHFAVKANDNIAILQLMRDAGVGADIVSGGELARCLHAGIDAAHIVFSGVGKTADEIAAALAAGVARFNVESHDELMTLNRVAAARGVVAVASVRINPDVDALTHEKISTGKAENKFGVAIDAARDWFARAGEQPHVRLDGLHVHIGSQILDVRPFRQAFARVAAFWRELEAAGHTLACIDVGGGLGVRYRATDRPPTAAEYVATIRDALAGFDGRILLEPGRWLVAEAGVLLSRVIRVKRGETRNFLVLDAAMNDLMRPVLYDAWHDIEPVANVTRKAEMYDIVGPVCETGDTFARERTLPACEPGDLVAIHGAGAYGASMASTYNARPRCAEVLLDAGRHAVIRRRQTIAELWTGEYPAEHWEMS